MRVEGIAVQHARKVLARMVEESVTDNDGTERWDGKLTELVKDVGGDSAMSHYSAIRNILLRSGAAEQEARGGGGRDSTWVILDAEADLTTANQKIRTTSDRLDNVVALIGGVDVKRALATLAADVELLKGSVGEHLKAHRQEAESVSREDQRKKAQGSDANFGAAEAIGGGEGE